MSEQEQKIMETFSLVGTQEQLDKYASDMKKIGWRLTYVGPSGHWLGEPIYEIKSSGEVDGNK